MLLLTSITDLLRVTTGSAVSTIEVHASYVDMSGTTVTPGRLNTRITTAATTTVVGSPAASTQRNVRGLYITNNSSGSNCDITVSHTDGTNAVELMQFILLPGENMTFNEEGGWRHRDKSGAEYPPAGLGAYNGRTIGFMKTGGASDAIGYWYGTWKDGGFPGAWSPGTPGLNGRVTDGVVAADYGCLPITNPATGANYITELQMAASVNHSHLFYDCLWVNSGLVVTTLTEQAITTPTLPARDVDGGTNGEGCMIGLMFTAASTLAAVNALSTVRYTNSKGVASRVATLVGVTGSQAPATPVIGTILWYNLAAGDTGVRSIEGFTIGATSWLTGSISLFIARDIATIGTTIPNVTAQKIPNTPGIRLYAGSCILHCALTSATTATFFSGEFAIMER